MEIKQKPQKRSTKVKRHHFKTDIDFFIPDELEIQKYENLEIQNPKGYKDKDFPTSNKTIQVVIKNKRKISWVKAD